MPANGRRDLIRRLKVKPGALFAGVKRSGCEVNHSSPSSADVKNKWTYTSAPPVGFHDVFLFQGFILTSFI